MSDVFVTIERIKSLRNLLAEEKFDEFILELQDNEIIQTENLLCDESQRENISQLISEINLLVQLLEEKNIFLSTQILNIKNQLNAAHAYQNTSH